MSPAWTILPEYQRGKDGQEEAQEEERIGRRRTLAPLEVMVATTTERGPYPHANSSKAVPQRVKARLTAVLTAVAEAPPPRFAGGLQWHAMHDEIKGYFEARDRHRPWLYRVFCLLERNGIEVGLGGSSIVLITGLRKPNEGAFSRADYAHVRSLGA